MRSLAALSFVVAAWSLAGCYLSHEREIERDASLPEAPRIVRIAAGDDHTCALDDERGIWCWGFAQQGQLGEGSGDPSRCDVLIVEGPFVDRPVHVGALDTFAIAAGATHTCAAVEGGYACWGANCRGQLGTGSTDGTAIPRATPFAVPVHEVWAGASHTCLGTSDGIACFGANERGQLGLGTTSPMSEPGASSPVLVTELVGVVGDAGLGDAHTCALEASGVVWCWGANGAGQLGDGTFELRSVPRFVRGLPPSIVDVTAGDRHTCAATPDEVWCWGWNERGQLGTGARCAPGDDDCAERPLPERVRFDGPIDEIEAGSQFTCLRSEGEIRCWGANDVGQLGDGSRTSSAVPVRVRGIDDATAISCGANHACAILADGRVMCWGRNAQGQIGDGTGEDALVPVETRFVAP